MADKSFSGYYWNDLQLLAIDRQIATDAIDSHRIYWSIATINNSARRY